MTDGKHKTDLITPDEIKTAIKDGSDTSMKIAAKIGAHHITIKRKLLAMFKDGQLTRYKIGQTYVYSVKGE